jgi:hypothetical protein
MRKAATVGAALVCVCVIFTLSGPFAQRMMNGDGTGGSSSGPVPVSVANFPQVQPVQVDKTVTVTGSVAVTNLPAVQQVAGMLNVGNLPLDGDGNLRTSGAVLIATPQSHVVGITTTLFSLTPTYPRILTLSRGCQAEFPGSRVCFQGEPMTTIPPPPEWSGAVWLVERPDALNFYSACYTSDGQSVPCKQNPWDPDALPAICCGY